MSDLQKPALSIGFKFVQMNFWEGRLFYPIDAFLKRVQPDIFSTQEMLSGPFSLTPSFWTAETLIEKEHFNHAISGSQRPGMARDGHDFNMECTTFTKGETACVFQKVVPLYKDSNDSSDHEESEAAYHSLVHMTLRLEDGAFVHVLNHHGRLVIGGRRGSPVADQNFQLIADYIATLTGPIILSGDFNIDKEAPSLDPLKKIGLVNLNDVHNISAARNEFAWRQECVSHIFINDQVVVDEYYVAQDNVSDHLPLVMSCRVKVA